MHLGAAQRQLDALLALFHATAEPLGRCTQVAATDMPEEYQRLLVHQEHMTVAVEAYHESLVSVDVLGTHITPTHYARQIVLRRQTDRSVVQYGIMRINLTQLSSEVRREIETQRRPLGRILVRHNVLRTIHVSGLWRIEPSTELCQYLELGGPRTTYGRTAGIVLDGTPAVEVLEIVTPV
jgi:chorismate-pyruvate lyase